MGGIRFKVKIDRIDRIADEPDVIIDYKTGSTSIRSGTPTARRAAIAALQRGLWGEPAGGGSFARVKTGEVKFRGVVDARG